MFGKINSSICFLRADLANYVEFVIWRFKGWQKCEGTQAASSQLRTEIRLRIFDTEWGSRKAVALTSEFLSKHGCMRVKMAFALSSVSVRSAVASQVSPHTAQRVQQTHVVAVYCAFRLSVRQDCHCTPRSGCGARAASPPRGDALCLDSLPQHLASTVMS